MVGLQQRKGIGWEGECKGIETGQSIRNDEGGRSGQRYGMLRCSLYA